MSVVINEDKENIDSIMKLVGGESGSGGVISTLDSIKSDIKTSTSSSKTKLDGFSITTSSDPVVLAFKDAVSSSGEIYVPYTNIDKSLDSGSFVALMDLLRSFYGALQTLKEKIEHNEEVKAHNDSINSRIGSSSKSWSKLNEYNAENHTNYSYKSETDLSSYKTNCESYLSAIQAVNFSYSENDAAAVAVQLVSEQGSSARNPDGTYNLDYLNENKVSASEAAQNAGSYNETGEYPEVIYLSEGQYIRYDHPHWGKYDYRAGDGGMFLVLDRATGQYHPVSADGHAVRWTSDWIGNESGVSLNATDLFNNVTTRRGSHMGEGDSRWVL